MKTVKMLIVLTAAALIFSLTATSFAAGDPNKAERRPGRERGGDRMAGRMQQISQDLNLTEEQKAQLSTVMANEANEIKVIQTDQSLTAEQKLAKVKEIRMTSREKISTLLTPEQKQKFNEAKRPPMNPMGKPENRLERMEKQLNLTEQQKTALKPILEEESAKLAQIEDSNTPGPEKQAKRMEINKSYQEKIDQILTPEQKEKRNQMKNMMKDRRKERTEHNMQKSVADQNSPKK